MYRAAFGSNTLGTIFRLLADTIVVVHVGFVLFVVFGGLLVLRWRRLAWLHIPSAAWGVAVELGDWVCPLTPLENLLRGRAGMAAYHGDFIEQNVLTLLYPERLTRGTQLVLGTMALAINALVYAWIARHRAIASAEHRRGAAGRTGCRGCR